MASTGAQTAAFPRPPHSVTDAEGRDLVVRVHGDEPAPLADCYGHFDDDSRAQGIPPRSVDRRREWIDDLLESPYNVVAWDGDAAVAHGVLMPHDDTAELAIFVRPDHQSAGVGTETVRCLLGHGRAGGLEHVHLVVEPSNTVAVRLYRTVGFAVTARHRGEYEMAREL